MSEKKPRTKTKLTRAQFPKDATAEEILAGIRKIQDECPERAHELYPKQYPAPPPQPGDQKNGDDSNTR